MQNRYVTIWFRSLKTDWLTRRYPGLRQAPFVFAIQDHGRKVITAANGLVMAQGACPGMTVEDARVFTPGLQVFDDRADLAPRLLKAIALWCSRFSPAVAVDLPDGVILDATGCPHLWGGELAYVTRIGERFLQLGYDVSVAMSDTIGASWAISRSSPGIHVLPAGGQLEALRGLPPATLRLEAGLTERLHKLGLRSVGAIVQVGRRSLKKRFGEALLLRLDQALGSREEIIDPVEPAQVWEDRLPCLEPVATRAGIEIALERALGTICSRLRSEGKGVRRAVFRCMRIDGKTEKIEVGTVRATNNEKHLFKLFELKLETIEPALGIDVFILTAEKVEDVTVTQGQFWDKGSGISNAGLSFFLDRLTGKFGEGHIYRYLPGQRHLPEKSIKVAGHLDEQPAVSWRPETRRPLQLLSPPEPIEVMAPIPDYPPIHFRYKGRVHKVARSDGPERIEQEWWVAGGRHRDYYCVEDEEGNRYWLFRSGHYTGARTERWFLHGFFA